MKDSFKYNFSCFTALIVDDDEMTLKYLTRSLEEYFGSVMFAKDGEEALDKFQTNRVDIIITDFYMPNKSGFDFIETIRKSGFKTPVIYISSYPNSEILLNVIRQNVLAFLVKPVDLNELLELVQDSILPVKIDSNLPSSINSQEYKLASGAIVNLKYKIIEKDGKKIFLTKKEFELMEIFIENEKHILSKDSIQDLLCKGMDVSESSVKSLINKIRSKIGNEAIVTIKNIGYKIMIEENKLKV